jgi:UDP-2,3-diacylglucosamine hydrolase
MWSKKSRISSTAKEENQKIKEEWLLTYSKEIEQKDHHDYYIFGHRHLPLELEVAEKSMYINLGEWVNYFTYGAFDGESFKLLTFED